VFDSRIERRIPNPTKTGVRDLPSAQAHPYPTNIVFKENPGGEFRKSYHGYPAGFAQLVYGNFDISLDHFSRPSPPYTVPHAPRGTLYFRPMPIWC